MVIKIVDARLLTQSYLTRAQFGKSKFVRTNMRFNHIKAYFCRPDQASKRVFQKAATHLKSRIMRNSISAFAIIVLLASCSTMKPVSSSKQTATRQTTGSTPIEKKNDIKFLDDISNNPQLAASIPDAKNEKKETVTATQAVSLNSNSKATALQIKYG